MSTPLRQPYLQKTRLQGAIVRDWQSCCRWVSTITCWICLSGLQQVNAQPAAPGKLARTAQRPGEWIQHRGDRALTGRSSIGGDLRSPVVKWKKFTGAPESLLELHLAAGAATADMTTAVDIPAADLNADSFDSILNRWTQLAAPDPDGDVPQRPLGTSIGKFLPQRAGLQKIEFDPQGFCKLMARHDRKWVEVWKSEKITDVMQGLNTLTGDFDNDGHLDVAFTPWTNLHVLDLATGELKGMARFYQDDALGDGRPYGWFSAFDLDGDGRREFIIISDTQCYISVLGWKERRPQFLWGRLFDRKSARQSTQLGGLLRPGPNPVQDVDGDGMPEIVVSYFGERKGESERLVEGEWRTVVLDGHTGQEKLALDGERLDGLHDLDGDGIAELFCSRTIAGENAEARGVSVINVQQGRRVIRWHCPDAAFQIQPLKQQPDYVHNAAAGGLGTVLIGPAQDSRPIFVTRTMANHDGRDVQLDVWGADRQGHIEKRGGLRGSGAEALAAAEGLLIRIRSADNDASRVQLDQATGAVLARRRAMMPPSVAVIGRLKPDSAPTVVVQTPGERIEAFQVDGETGAVRTLWDAPGRGMHEGSHHRSGGAMFTGVVLADLTGDGHLAVVSGARGRHNQASVVARGPAGEELWHHDFDYLDGAPPGFTLPGLAFWFAGRFTDPARDDILVGVKNHVATRLVLLDGRTGKELWSRQAGGMFMAVFDHDGDGLDDALTTCWSEIHVLHGTTGRTLLQLNTVPPGLFGDKLWPNDAYSCAVDVLGRRTKQILYWPSYAARALVGGDGKLVWQFNDDRLFFGTPSIYPGIGDFDGDGRLELLSPGDHPSEMGFICRCFNATTGTVRWELPIDMAGPPGSAVTLDIDGDRRDECLFPVSNTLIAVGQSRDRAHAGEIRWQLPFPAAIGPLSIADIEGNGTAQIVVVCADGYVYGIGGK